MGCGILLKEGLESYVWRYKTIAVVTAQFTKLGIESYRLATVGGNPVSRSSP